MTGGAAESGEGTMPGAGGGRDREPALAGWAVPAVLLLAAAAAGAARWGMGLPVPAPLPPTGPAAASPEIAAADPAAAEEVERRVRAFLSGRGPDTLALDGGELEAYLAAAVEPRLPEGISDVGVRLEGERLLLSFLMQLEEGSQMGAAMRRVFGDSARVEAELAPRVERPGEGRAVLRTLRVGGVQVPGLLVPGVLRSSGLPVDPNRMDAIAFPLSPVVAELAVRNDRLVAVRVGGTG